MSVKLMGEVWGLELPHNQQVVLLALADHADDDGRNAYPGVDRLAWKTGYHERTVRRVLNTLEREGLIDVENDKRGGRGRTTMYRLRLENGVKKPPFDSGKGGRLPGNHARKGDTSPGNEARKGDNTPGNVAERVTSDAQKGDTAMSPQPSGNHQEDIPKPPSSQDAPSGTATAAATGGDIDRDALIAEMEAIAAAAAERIEDDRERRRFEALGRLLASGDDATAWRNPKTGSRLPWPERPRRLRVAVGIYEAGERDDIRRALQLAIQRQDDPLPVRSSDEVISAAEEAKRYERHRAAAGRPPSEVTRAGALLGGEPEPEEDPDELRRQVEAWAEANPRDAQRLRQLATEQVADDFPEGFRTPHLVESKFRLLVREEMGNAVGPAP